MDGARVFSLEQVACFHLWPSKRRRREILAASHSLLIFHSIIRDDDVFVSERAWPATDRPEQRTDGRDGRGGDQQASKSPISNFHHVIVNKTSIYGASKNAQGWNHRV